MIVLHQYRLTTAQIYYRRPDHLWLLQEYIWQEYDRVPGYPTLRKFLTFWRDNLDGPLHTVIVADAEINLDERFHRADFVRTVQ
jgi:uncharacterized protein Usg